LKAWQETEASLRNQLQQLTEKEAQLRKNFEEINNSAEGLKEQLRLVQVHVIFYG
jgi:predicted  nucleic acid-binding Zn-ribbon protein